MPCLINPIGPHKKLKIQFFLKILHFWNLCSVSTSMIQVKPVEPFTTIHIIRSYFEPIYVKSAFKQVQGNLIKLKFNIQVYSIYIEVIFNRPGVAGALPHSRL